MANEMNEFKKGLQVESYPLAKVKEPNDTERADIYQKYVNMQKDHFLAFINYVNNILAVLKYSGSIVSGYTRFSARIKSTESALNNDKKEGKALNDVFGLEIDFATEEEKAFVLELLRDSLTETKSKVHNKDNGYVASHVSGYPTRGADIIQAFERITSTVYTAEGMYNSEVSKFSPEDKAKLEDPETDRGIREYFEMLSSALNEIISNINAISPKHLKIIKTNLKIAEQEYKKQEKLKSTKGDQEKSPDLGAFPIIECKFLTIDKAINANLGAANHGDYKGEDLAIVQKEYDREGGIPLSRIPTMYYSTVELDRNGVPVEPKLLSSDETLKVLYPSLIINQPLNIRGGEQK